MQLSTFASEKAALLRFLGYYKQTFDVEEPSLSLLARPDLGERVEQYCNWLQSRQLKWSSISN